MTQRQTVQTQLGQGVSDAAPGCTRLCHYYSDNDFSSSASPSMIFSATPGSQRFPASHNVFDCSFKAIKKTMRQQERRCSRCTSVGSTMAMKQDAVTTPFSPSPCSRVVVMSSYTCIHTCTNLVPHLIHSSILSTLVLSHRS